MSVPANFFDTYDVVASPTDDTETVIAILGGVGELVPGLAVHLSGWANIEVDTDATGITLAFRRDSLTGTGPIASGTVTFTATGGVLTWECNVEGVDTPGDFAGAIYVLTATIADANGPSTVGAVGFHARVS